MRRNWAHAQFAIRKTIDDAWDFIAINPDVAQHAIIHSPKSFNHFPALPAAECVSEPMSKHSRRAVALICRSSG